MNTAQTFSAHTNQRWYAFYILIISLVLALAAALFMWFWLRIPGPAILVGGTGLLCGMTGYFITLRQAPARLQFYGSSLQIFLPTGQVMTLETLPAKAFIFQQNPLERKFRTGRLKIKGAYLTLYGLSDFDGLKEYIRSHFPSQ